MSRFGNQNALKHGYAKRNNHHKLYIVWCNMISRCYNTSSQRFSNYGGRGITVCDRWLESFNNFLSDVGSLWKPNLQIDRINNDGNYEINNIRFITREEQAFNKSNTRKLTYNKTTMTLTEWSKLIGIKTTTLIARLDYYNWSIERTLTTPINTKYRTKHYQEVSV